MSAEVHTSLRGRSRGTEVLPFGLREDIEVEASWVHVRPAWEGALSPESGT